MDLGAAASLATTATKLKARTIGLSTGRATPDGADAVSIQVAVRVRPTEAGSEATVRVDSESELVLTNPSSAQTTAFCFDYCYGPLASQLQVARPTVAAPEQAAAPRRVSWW